MKLSLRSSVDDQSRYFSDYTSTIFVFLVIVNIAYLRSKRCTNFISVQNIQDFVINTEASRVLGSRNVRKHMWLTKTRKDGT